MISLCLFDFDGVIADTEKYHTLALQKYLQQYFNIQIHQSELKKFTGLSGDTKVKTILKEKNLEQLWQKFDINDLMDVYRSLFKSKIQPRVGFKELLSYLNKQYILATIVTSVRQSDIKLFLENNSLSDYINLIIGYDEVFHHKPDPEPYLKAIQLSESEPNNCLAIEDTLPGLQSAINADIKYVIHFSKKKTNNVRIFDTVSNFSQLRVLIERVNNGESKNTVEG